MRKTQVGTNITEWMTIIFKTKNDSQGNFLIFNVTKFMKKQNCQLRLENRNQSETILKARIKTMKKRKIKTLCQLLSHIKPIIIQSLQTFLIYRIGIILYT